MIRTTNMIRLIASTALATAFVWAATRGADGAPAAPVTPATQPWQMMNPETPSEAQPVAVPEPQTLGALALAACAFMARRGNRGDARRN